eukprot:2255016-Pleurochrysis_carterae.AAC.1
MGARKQEEGAQSRDALLCADFLRMKHAGEARGEQVRDSGNMCENDVGFTPGIVEAFAFVDAAWDRDPA